MQTVAISHALRNVKECHRRLASAAGRRHITRPDDKAALLNAVNAYAWRSLWPRLNAIRGAQ